VIALPRPCICLVTNRRALCPDARTEREELLQLGGFLDEAIAAGIDMIQIRERDLSAKGLRDLVKRLVSRNVPASTKVFVNDRVDVAVAAGAHGVHLRGDGPPVARVRELLGPEVLVGRSIHSADEVRDDVDVLVFGTVFPSGPKPLVGVDRLADAARRAAVPVLAIGGVTPERAAVCRAAGAAGVAAIGAFLPPGRSPTSLGPAAAVVAFRSGWDSGT
jgi:thiamine-phosphate pyrophosphorylase